MHEAWIATGCMNGHRPSRTPQRWHRAGGKAPRIIAHPNAVRAVRASAVCVPFARRNSCPCVARLRNIKPPNDSSPVAESGAVDANVVASVRRCVDGGAHLHGKGAVPKNHKHSTFKLHMKWNIATVLKQLGRGARWHFQQTCTGRSFPPVGWLPCFWFAFHFGSAGIYHIQLHPFT